MGFGEGNETTRGQRPGPVAIVLPYRVNADRRTKTNGAGCNSAVLAYAVR
jgi:hypothetical protein